MDNVIRMAEIEQRQDLVLGQLVYAMKAILLRSTRNEKRCFSIEVPITWWDHLKDDMAGSGSWFWRWVVSKLAPVEYRTESKEFEVSIRLCPHNDSYLSEDPVVHFNFLEPKSGIE
jgi:hypothetical protein